MEVCKAFLSDIIVSGKFGKELFVAALESFPKPLHPFKKTWVKD